MPTSRSVWGGWRGGGSGTSCATPGATTAAAWQTRPRRKTSSTSDRSNISGSARGGSRQLTGKLSLQVERLFVMASF